jgi:hypothetical protein
MYSKVTEEYLLYLHAKFLLYLFCKKRVEAFKINFSASVCNLQFYAVHNGSTEVSTSN